MQLSTPKVQKMCILLERTQSSYYPAFKNMLDSVKAGWYKISTQYVSLLQVFLWFCFLQH